MSALVVGFKLNCVKDVMQSTQRRNELKTNLSLLRRRVEAEMRIAWADDTTHDRTQRGIRIAAIDSSVMHSPLENGAVDKGLAMFQLFENSVQGSFRRAFSRLASSKATMLARVATGTKSETKFDEASRPLLSRGETCRNWFF